ncbi:unnamed protein product [Coffea canephora]|uniref:DH200=94 genomic scaffold, scaffold_7015 n=1 Tax=Coffea canephora TaxID=49390 RepID=A0A068VQ18_COFCA|nr:unnamed protein product [Coffea canephora]
MDLPCGLVLFKHRKLHSLYEALEKVKGELMLLGFISLLLTVFQGLISHVCIPHDSANIMLPCKLKTEASSGGSEHLDIAKYGRRLLAEDVSLETCACQVSCFPKKKSNLYFYLLV